MAERYFYTTDTPHQWSSGPFMAFLKPGTFEEIFSLEEAREIAESLRKGRSGQEDYVRTSYGVLYDTDGLDS